MTELKYVTKSFKITKDQAYFLSTQPNASKYVRDAIDGTRTKKEPQTPQEVRSVMGKINQKAAYPWMYGNMEK